MCRLNISLCFTLLLLAAAARADILPQPDRGSPVGTAGGLEFKVELVDVEMGPINGPHYKKEVQVVILAGCADDGPNCGLAREKNAIGMEVQEVDGHGLQPARGMVQQILDAFAAKTAGPTVTLTLYSTATNAGPVRIAFARY